MQILVVKTADGAVYFSDQRNASRMAAVRLVIDQLQNHYGEVFELDAEEAYEAIKKIENSTKPFEYCLTESLILRVPLRDS